MLLVKPSHIILSTSVDALRAIEGAGRTCYKSEDRITDDSAAPFSAMLISRGHEAMLEHASLSVRFVCDRGVSHELVRHRLCAFAQESTRYCDYIKGQVTFVIPPWCHIQPQPMERFVYKEPGSDEVTDVWLEAMLEAEEFYKVLRSRGWKPEQARTVLPNSLKTEIVVTTNMREWRHILKLRTAKPAHPQMRELMVPLLKELQQLVPVLFDSITPYEE